MRLIISLPVSLLAGLGAGFAFFRGPAQLAPWAGTVLSEKDWPISAAEWPDSVAATDAKAQRLLAAALRKGNDFERDNELYLAIEALSAKDFDRLLTDLGALEVMAKKLGALDQETGRELATALLGRWLKVDPDKVLKWSPRVFVLVPTREDRRVILDVLAAKRPEDLLALVSLAKDAAERKDIVFLAMRELAARDAEKTRAWLKGCTDPADRAVAEKAIRAGTVQADPLRAIELAGSIENRQEAVELLRAAAEDAAKIGPGVLRQLATTPMLPWMLSPMLGEFANREPELAVDLVLEDGYFDKLGGFQTAFRVLAQRDPELAIAKLDGLGGEGFAAAVSAIGAVWSARDPAAALDWLAQIPADERADPHYLIWDSQDALEISFYDWARRGPDAARAWADALPSGPQRDAIQTKFAQALIVRGEIAEGIRVLGRLGSVLDPKVIANIARESARTDPQAAADWAIAQPPGPAQSSALASVVSSWANDNPSAVEDWLEQFPPGDARDRSVAAFLGRSDAWTAGQAARSAEFEAWFDLIEDPWWRAQAATSSFWERNKSNPAEARAWLSSLPNVDPQLIHMALRNSRK